MDGQGKDEVREDGKGIRRLYPTTGKNRHETI
jgi:hypothetical protein